jgi:hypothetical protein
MMSKCLATGSRLPTFLQALGVWAGPQGPLLSPIAAGAFPVQKQMGSFPIPRELSFYPHGSLLGLGPQA